MIKDITGQKFGRLKAIGLTGRDKWDNAIWKCLCDCGNIVTIRGVSLRRGNTKSCGCFLFESRSKTGKRSKTHGFSKKSFYRIFNGIKQRCNNKEDKRFRGYGERGIKCLWTSFDEFKKDMYETYRLHIKEFGKKNTSIDRIDNNGNYCKENCRWATPKEQSNNLRNNVFVEYRNESKSLNEWSKYLGIPYQTLYGRIFTRGWSLEKALTKNRY